MSSQTARPRSPLSKLPKLQRTSDLGESEFATIFIFGPAGVGKTTLAKTLKGNTLILAAEMGDQQGLQSIRSADIPFLELRDWETAEAAIAALSGPVCKYDDYEVHNVVCDSYTGFGDLWQDKALRSMGQTDMTPKPGFDPRNVYSNVAERGRQTTKKLLGLRANVIFLLRESYITEKDAEGNETHIPVPALPGQKLPMELPGHPDAVLRMRILNGKRILVTQHEGRVVSRVRLDTEMAKHLPKYIEPNLDALIRVMKGDMTAMSELTPRKDNK